MTTIPGAHYFQPAWIQTNDTVLTADVVVYGGTAAGVIASQTLAERGRSVILLNPALQLGGMTTGGLGLTDFGEQSVIGGRSYQLYKDIGSYYGRDEPEWSFEPKAAQAVIDRYSQTDGIQVFNKQFLDSVQMEQKKIVSIKMLGGLTAKAKVFLDCTYEGDLMAKAGVHYTVGREPNCLYGETINGVQKREKHQFSHPIDPYIVPGDPSSGTLPRINQQDAAPDGSGDSRIQAYNFRMCMTDDPELRVDWIQPDSYQDIEYELARRWFNSESDEYNDYFPNYTGLQQDVPKKFDVMTQLTPGGFYKTDTNNHGPFSSDFIGANYAWPEASYAERERIFQQHVDYTMGFHWFMANDPDIPKRHGDLYRRFGLSKDEFLQTGHWPHQLYIREARRMVSDYVLNEHDTQHHRQPEDPIARGSYAMDSHNCQRFIRNGRVYNEGDVQLNPAAHYGVSYRSIVPKKGECENILVPVCISASHIAFGSVRMEPVFIAMAESAAIAADLALKEQTSVQAVNYSKLQHELSAVGQVTIPQAENS